MKKLLVPICVDTKEELPDIRPFQISMALLDKIAEYAEDPDKIYEEVEDVTDVPAVSTSKRTSFIPMPGDEVHLLQFGSKEKREERKRQRKKSKEKPLPDFVRMNQTELVLFILEKGWTSVKDIGKISLEECERKIPLPSIRRILSSNSATIESRQQEMWKEYRLK